MNFAIRDYLPADLDQVVALWHQCELVRPWNDPRSDISRAVSDSQSALLVACRDDQIAGTVMVGDDGHRGWVYYLAVDPRFRRKRLGAELMSAAGDWLTRRGCPKIMLMIRMENEAVRNFYETLEFEQEERVIMARWLVDKPG